MAARFCSQCGQEVSATARFCPNCATPLMAPSANPTPPRTPRPPAPPVTALGSTALGFAPPENNAAPQFRKLLVPGLIAALVLLVIAVALLAAQSRRQTSLLVSSPNVPAATPAVTNAPASPVPTAPPLTNAPAGPASNGPALTNAPTQPPVAGPAVTNAPNTPAPSLPPDVAAYLSFLKGIEARRVAMNNDVSGATAMLATAQGMSAGQGLSGAEADPEGAEDPAKKSTQSLSQGYSDYALKWQGLIRDFRATPAPPACQALAARYLTFVSDYTTVITKMQVALLNHDPKGLPDLSAVTQVQAQVSADGALADTELGSICAHYGVEKPFIIASEGGSPSLLGH